MDTKQAWSWRGRDLVAHSAGERMVGTYELLERILSYLPPIELFRVARVNTSFSNILRPSSVLLAKFRMVLELSQDSSTFPLEFGLFENIGCSWSYPFGRQQQETYILVRMRKSELAAECWRRKQGSWRTLLLSTKKTTSVTVHVESWSQFRSALDKGQLGQYSSELRYEKDSLSLATKEGITLGDLADVAFELHDLDPDVDVTFSTYVNAEGEAIVHDWERAKLLPYHETIGLARRTWNRERARRNEYQNFASSVPENDKDHSRAMLGSEEKQPLQPSVGGSPCAPVTFILRGFCEHEGVCLV